MKTIVVTGSTDPYTIGSTSNNGVYFDGTYYWLFYADGGELHCKYGVDPSALADSSTALNGLANLSNIRNGGRCYSIHFGTANGSTYAWCLFSETTIGRWFTTIRWELTANGLAYPVESVTTIVDADRRRATITPNYSSQTNLLLSSIQSWNSFSNTRSNNEQLSADAGRGSINSHAIDFPEHTRILELADGYIAIGLDQGNADEQNGAFGHAREWLRPDLTTGWGAEVTVEGDVIGATTGDGDFTDQNHALNTSSTGQQDIAQTTDGKVWVAYCDNTDLSNGDYGVVKLLQRGSLRADRWTLVSNDVIGNGVPAWSIALACDGSDLWIVYVKDSQGVRDSSVCLRKYNVAQNTFDTEMKLADIQANHTFGRMYTQWRFANNRLIVAWSESDGATYDIALAEYSVLSNPNTAPHYPKEVLSVSEVQRLMQVA